MTGDTNTAIAEQAWKYASESVFNAYQGTPKRRCYERFNLTQLDMGDGRLPQQCFDSTLQTKLFDDLNAVGFWEKSQL